MSRPPTLTDRLLGAYPLAVVYLALLFLYAWQTTRISGPWVFSDELKWADLSRAIAHTGHAELRGRPASFSSLYAYYIAPSWWLGATGPGYAAAKYLNAVAVAASVFPAYALARLFVPRFAAILVGTAAAAIPAVAYSGALIPESLAYFWSALALCLLTRALITPTRRSVVLAVVALLVAPAVRSELLVLIPAALIAVAIVVATSPRARSVIDRWTWGERFGAAFLVFGAVIAADVLVAHHSYQWYIGTHFWHRAFTYGLWAVGAYAIGIGVLPLVLALAWLLEGRIASRENRVLLGLLVGAALAFCGYTAVKASFLSTTFAIRVEERNVVYLSPLVFLAAARWLVTARTRIVPLVLAALGVGYLLQSTPYHAYEHFYSDAPGLSILQWLNQKWFWTNSDLKWLLFGILIVGALLALAATVARRRRVGRIPILAGAIVIALAVIGWNLTGEIAAANASRSSAHFYRSLLPTPPDWIDRETGRAHTMFIGEQLQNSFSFSTLEFWNQSIQDVWTVDGSAPGPGAETTPNFLGTDGRLGPQPKSNWAATDPVVKMVGKLAESAGGIDLYRLPHPVRMLSFEKGITPDGWMETSSTFVRFAARPIHGTLSVSLDRTFACSTTIPVTHVVIRVYHLRIDGDSQPVPGAAEQIRRVAVKPCAHPIVAFTNAVAPLIVESTAAPTFSAGGRGLSAQTGYTFTS